MPHSTELPPGVIEAEINFYLEPPNGEKYPVQYRGTVGSKRQNWDTHVVQVTDLRGMEDEFTLDKNGFQVVPFSTKGQIHDDDERIKQDVYPEAVELIKKTTAATFVHVMNHIIRKDPHQAMLDIPKDLPDNAPVYLRDPAMFAHIDQTYDGAAHSLSDIKEADELRPRAKKRWGIINVWHPLKTINREPLAVCDARSVTDEDLREVTLRVKRPKDGVVSDYDSMIWYVKHNPKQKWYWPKNLTSDEALLIKIFDSKLDGRARRTPHSAIRTPDDNGPPRESIEIRCFVFWEDQDAE